MLRGEGMIRPFSQPRLRTATARRGPAQPAADFEGTALCRRCDHIWDPRNAARLLHKQLPGDQMLVVSNREPYIHMKRGGHRGAATGQRPGHGGRAGDARLLRDMDRPRQRHCRPRGGGRARPRSRSTGRAELHAAAHLAHQEEEEGYYYGFANEGLWPLCHIAHVRPVFRTSDWEQYRRVNQRFADAVVEEAQDRRSRRAGPGLPLRAAAAPGPQAAAARHHHHLLAHSLAEPRIVRHLPVARRDPRGHAGQHDPRLPHALPLPQFLETVDRYPRGAHRARVVDHLARRSA